MNAPVHKRKSGIICQKFQVRCWIGSICTSEIMPVKYQELVDMEKLELEIADSLPIRNSAIMEKRGQRQGDSARVI